MTSVVRCVSSWLRIVMATLPPQKLLALSLLCLHELHVLCILCLHLCHVLLRLGHESLHARQRLGCVQHISRSRRNDFVRTLIRCSSLLPASHVLLHCLARLLSCHG